MRATSIARHRELSKPNGAATWIASASHAMLVSTAEQGRARQRRSAGPPGCCYWSWPRLCGWACGGPECRCPRCFRRRSCPRTSWRGSGRVRRDGQTVSGRDSQTVPRVGSAGVLSAQRLLTDQTAYGVSEQVEILGRGGYTRETPHVQSGNQFRSHSRQPTLRA